MSFLTRAKQRKNDYESTFNSPHGKRVLHDLMRRSHMTGSTFSKDPHEMALKEGERNLMLYILHNLNIREDELERLIEEEHDHVDF